MIRLRNRIFNVLCMLVLEFQLHVSDRTRVQFCNELKHVIMSLFF